MLRGEKWLREATYLTAEDRRAVMAECRRAREAGLEAVGIRPASYIGEPSPIAAVTYNGGASLFGLVYRVSA